MSNLTNIPHLTFILLIGVVVFYFLNMARNAKVEKQQRQAQLDRENVTKTFKIQKKALTKNSSAKKKSTTKVSLKKSSVATPRCQLFSYASFTGLYGVNAPFSLIDFETSGFHPNSGRILEVAVIKIDSYGKIIDLFTTLINPEDGNVGRTDIHQITLGMVRNAPRLSEVVGDLLNILDSSIVVAHNARFEENFLESAFSEVGIRHPLMPTIDTLWLSRQVLNLPNYKLKTIIDEFGYEFEDAHTALGDVRAMAKILPEMLKIGKSIKFPTQLLKSPSYNATGRVLPRKSNVRKI